MGHKLAIVIETSGRLGSVGIGKNGNLISEIPFSGHMRHSAELFDALKALLEQADATASDIGQVYITAGPGSFTGLRIAVTAAKMFGFAQESQIVAADTMDVIAENALTYKNSAGQTQDCIATILDAKKNLFYTAVFDRVNDQWQKCFATEIMTAQQLLDWLEANNRKNVGLLGEGLVYYAEKFQSPLTWLMDQSLWSATAAGLYRVGCRMAKQGLFTEPLDLAPKYLRQPDAVVKRIKRNS